MMRLLVHAGAGNIAPTSDLFDLEQEIRAALTDAVRVGQERLTAGGAAVDAAVAAVRTLEDCPYFNAGRGSVLNREGEVEMDACVIDGATRDAGAIACVRGIRNPIDGAQALLREPNTVLLAGAAADRFATEAGCATEPPAYFVTDFWRERWRASQGEAVAELDHSARTAPAKHGTVGAVALDAEGRLAAATSTGGLLHKLPGRISDSALPGAGTYADELLAVSFTGTGEHIIRLTSGAALGARVRRGEELEHAVARTLDELAAIGGQAGLIAIDRSGRISLAANTSHLLRAWTDEAGNIQTALAVGG